MKRVTLLILLASSMLALGQPMPAAELRDALKSAKGKNRVDLLADLSWTEVWGDAELGYTLAKEGEGLADKIGYDVGEARCKAMIGMSILFQGHSPEALEYLLESLPELKKEEDPFWMFTVYSALGYVDWDQGEYKKAMGYFRQARSYTDLMQNSNAQISVLSDLGGCHLHLGNTDSALHYISQAFVKAEVTRDTMQLAITGSQLAIAHRRLGNLDLAQQYCERSIFYSKLSLWNPRKNYLTMAQIYNDQGNTDSVISNCYRALNAAEEGAFLDTSSISAFELLADAYETKGIMDSAMKYLRKGIEANEMVASREKTKRIEGIDFERQLNESRIEQARKDATMKANVDRQRLIKNLGFAGIGLVLIFLIILLNRFRATRKSKLETEAEKERGDELLLNILPPEVAEELKNTGKARSVRFDEVSVLFTDFVGFTEITEDWSAEEVVWEINTCFSEFDRIAAKYGIEKIKTIGDSYMCAGGIPTPSNTHVIDTIKAALEFRAFIQQRIDKLKKDGREAFQIRIGIHTGPVVAGIVGVKKFQYDIWGSTVNTASRMESHGESGKVNISEATYSRVSGDPGFMFTKRETLEVKGKGSMQMYFVDVVEIEALL